MSLNSVQAALVSQVQTALLASAFTDVVYDNEPFSPPEDGKWAEVFFMPNQPSVETLGAEGEDFVDGLVQINLKYPLKTGSSASRADYEVLRSWFRAGSGLTYSGQEVVVRNCGRSGSSKDDAWFKVVVTINWYALIAR